MRGLFVVVSIKKAEDGKLHVFSLVQKKHGLRRGCFSVAIGLLGVKTSLQQVSLLTTVTKVSIGKVADLPNYKSDIHYNRDHSINACAITRREKEL